LIWPLSMLVLGVLWLGVGRKVRKKGDDSRGRLGRQMIQATGEFAGQVESLYQAVSVALYAVQTHGEGLSFQFQIVPSPKLQDAAAYLLIVEDLGSQLFGVTTNINLAGDKWKLSPWLTGLVMTVKLLSPPSRYLDDQVSFNG
jgi:hypothetical protein